MTCPGPTETSCRSLTLSPLLLLSPTVPRTWNALGECLLNGGTPGFEKGGVPEES